MTDDNKDRADNSDDGVISRVRTLCEEAQDYWAENYERGKEDLEFVTVDGAQWSDDVIRQREAAGIPTFTFNLLRTYCRQQINSARLNRQQIKAEPVDDLADKEVAKILNGLIRDTEISSNAENAYDAAAEAAVYRGLGVIRGHIDYVSNDSFQQEPVIKTIHNSASVYIDPASKALDGSDMRHAVIISWEPKDDIIKEHGEDAAKDFDSDNGSVWYNKTDKTVCVAELFELQRKPAKLYLLVDGTTTFDKPADPEQIQDERDSFKEVCWWYKITGSKVLEDREFGVPIIPIFPVYGDVTWNDEERIVYSMVHFARDPQKLYNFWKSSEAQQIADGLKQQYLADEEAIEGHSEWADPSTAQVLRYNTLRDQTGEPLPPPQLLPALSVLNGILNAADGTKDNMAEILNMQPASLGGDVNNQSGKAIGLLQQRADVAHFHLVDNLNKTLAQVGRFCLAVYQKYYNTQMVKRITGEDGQADKVVLNADPSTAQGQKGAVIEGLLNNITVGRYDIRMATGASYISQRQENKQWLTQILQFMPQLSQVAPDLLLKAFDDGNMFNDIVERFRKTLPPNLLDDAQTEPMQQVAQQYEAKLQEMGQQLEAAMAEIKGQQSIKMAEFQHAERMEEIKASNQQQIEELKAQNAIDIALIKGHDAEDLQKLKGEFDLIKQGMGMMQPDMQYQDDGNPTEQPPPEQFMQPEPPLDGGFFMPEQPNNEGDLIDNSSFSPEFNALDASQIENTAPPMAAPQQTELDGFQGTEL